MGQNNNPSSARIAFYNLENLFDTIDDPETKDEEFTPKGQRYWTGYRYWQKSNMMAKAILSIGEWEPPCVVGLAEVENRKVVEDLIETLTLRKYNYKVLHYDSEDRRGIDVAMIYREDLVEVLYSNNISVTIPNNPEFKTRDILYAKVRLGVKDTVHLLFCHWPSRYGGQAQSEPKRIQAAKTVRATIDSLLLENRNASIIIAGDLNDEWNNISVRDHLVTPITDERHLFNLMAELDQNNGSHRYRGVWTYLDQIIVSNTLLNKYTPYVESGAAQVCKEDILLEKDEKYPGQKPFRTFNGMRYNNGFSDHLPVYIDLQLSQ